MVGIALERRFCGPRGANDEEERARPLGEHFGGRVRSGIRW